MKHQCVLKEVQEVVLRVASGRKVGALSDNVPATKVTSLELLSVHTQKHFSAAPPLFLKAPVSMIPIFKGVFMVSVKLTRFLYN